MKTAKISSSLVLVTVLSNDGIFNASFTTASSIHSPRRHNFFLRKDTQHYDITSDENTRGLQQSKIHHETKHSIVRDLKAKIVGGVDVRKPTTFPFYGFPVGVNNCGATLIYEDIMVSAGHCYSYFKENGVFIGGNEITGASSIQHAVDYEIQHPQFDLETTDNDIMLIKLVEPTNVTPIQLNYDNSEPKIGESLIIIGYGALHEYGTFSYDLQLVELEATPGSNCSMVYVNYNNQKMLCVGSSIPGKDSCKGDSGGPVISQRTRKQVGLVSYGKGCARPGFPSVNTRISAYKDFIEQGICDHSNNPPERCATKLIKVTQMLNKPLVSIQAPSNSSQLNANDNSYIQVVCIDDQDIRHEVEKMSETTPSRCNETHFVSFAVHSMRNETYHWINGAYHWSNGTYNWSNGTYNWSNGTYNWSDDTYHWSNDTFHWINDTFHWSNDTFHWSNDTFHWSNDTFHWSNDTFLWSNDNHHCGNDTSHQHN